MLTIFDDDEYVYEALALGASGYLLKTVKPDMLVSSIRAVRDGAVLMSPTLAQRFVHYGRPQDGAPNHTPDPWIRTLSPREHTVLSLLLDHLSNREIAERLHLTEATVRNYMTTIYDKMGADDRFHAIRIAERNRGFLNHSQAT